MLRAGIVLNSLCLIGLIGCSGNSGPERCAVSGVVEYEGVPVESGSIAFVPLEGQQGPTAGGIIKNGHYELTDETGPSPGKHRVQIIGMREAGTKTVEGIGGATGGPSGTTSVAEVTMFIPSEYNEKTILNAEIKSGKNTFDYKLPQK